LLIKRERAAIAIVEVARDFRVARLRQQFRDLVVATAAFPQLRFHRLQVSGRDFQCARQIQRAAGLCPIARPEGGACLRQCSGTHADEAFAGRDPDRLAARQ
jgi:hypothetical protein